VDLRMSMRAVAGRVAMPRVRRDADALYGESAMTRPAKRERVRGIIDCIFRVTCSGCIHSAVTSSYRDQIGAAKTRKEAKLRFEEAGWEESKGEGWFCPGCVKDFELSGVGIITK